MLIGCVVKSAPYYEKVVSGQIANISFVFVSYEYLLVPSILGVQWMQLMDSLLRYGV